MKVSAFSTLFVPCIRVTPSCYVQLYVNEHGMLTELEVDGTARVLKHGLWTLSTDKDKTITIQHKTQTWIFTADDYVTEHTYPLVHASLPPTAFDLCRRYMTLDHLAGAVVITLFIALVLLTTLYNLGERGWKHEVQIRELIEHAARDKRVIQQLEQELEALRARFVPVEDYSKGLANLLAQVPAMQTKPK